jgi:hypothetical protein
LERPTNPDFCLSLTTSVQVFDASPNHHALRRTSIAQRHVVGHFIVLTVWPESSAVCGRIASIFKEYHFR